MRISIDVSQMAYEGTGVANYLLSLVESLLNLDKANEYILFASSFRSNIKDQISKIKSKNKNAKVKLFRFPPFLLDFLWNRLHLCPIEWFVGAVDVFITSDWTEPPALKAKKITILYDLIIKRYPEETDNKIVQVQTRRLNWVKKESDIIICISESTKIDAMKILGIPEKRLKVVYPGI